MFLFWIISYSRSGIRLDRFILFFPESSIGLTILSKYGNLKQCMTNFRVYRLGGDVSPWVGLKVGKWARG